MELDKLKLYISARLSNLVTIEVTNKIALKKSTYPLLIYKFKPCTYNVRHRKDWILELDFWDNKIDDSDIIQQSIYVKNGRLSYIGLNNSTQSEEEGFYVCEIEFESPIEEIEPGISRYNQRYLVKVD